MSDVKPANLLGEIDDRGVATLTLNRPGVSNAFDDQLIDALTLSLTVLATDEKVRMVFLTGAGKHFSAGGDLNWMRRMAHYSREENFADARRLALLMHTLRTLPKPTVALVNGAAIGGGAGLVSCCDLAVAAEGAVFSLSEVGLGLVPAVVGPYMVDAVGPRWARRLFLTGERIDAELAREIGLVHEVHPLADLPAAKERITRLLLSGGPWAQVTAKKLVDDIWGRPIDESLREEMARLIATVRSSAEAQEGMAAFLEKRKPYWREDI